MRLAQFTYLLVTAVFAILTNDVIGIRIARQKIYQDLQNRYFCFRRLNADGQVGCSSDASGNVGVVHVVKTEWDMDWVLQKGPTAPFIPVITMQHFTTDTLKRFKQKADRVSGILLIKTNDTQPSYLSPDKACPNANFGLYTKSAHSQYANCAKQKDQAWNKLNPITNLMFEDWPFPIFYVDEEASITNITACYERFNKPIKGEARSWPLCSMELFIQMNAAVSTSLCMRRNTPGLPILLGSSHYCDPLSSTNIFGTLFANSSQSPEPRSTVMVSTRIDSFSTFDDMSPGADSAMTSLVAWFGIAYTLAQHRQSVSASGKSLLFAAFDGETFDYIGSSRTAYDMQADKFPKTVRGPSEPPTMKLNAISHVIELNQVGGHSPSDYKIFAHSDPVTRTGNVDTQVTHLINTLKTSAAKTQLQFFEADRTKGLPPASVQNFLKADNDIATVVLTNHEAQFTNTYYNSFLDTVDNLSGDLTDELAQLVRTVSIAIGNEFLGLKDFNPVVDKQIIGDLIECFLRNNTCKLFQMVGTSPIPVIDTPNTAPLYVSVSGNAQRQLFNQYIQYLLALLTGEETGLDEDKCKEADRNDKTHEYVWMRGWNYNGTCIKSTAFATNAVSPAFDNNNWTSTEYSTWTESVWTKPRARIFLRPSLAKEWVTIILGVLVVTLSFAVVQVAKKNSDLLFFSNHDSSPNGNGANLLGRNNSVGC